MQRDLWMDYVNVLRRSKMFEGADGIFPGFEVEAGDKEICCAAAILQSFRSPDTNENILHLFMRCGSGVVIKE